MSYKNIFTLVLIMCLLSCKNDTKKDKIYLPASGGTTNLLTIVSDDSLWKGEVGDAIRLIFAAPVYGLPQEEPIFTLKQMKPKAFHDYVKKSRTFIELKKGAPKGIKFVKDVYATPQFGIIVSGENNEELMSVLNENSLLMTNKTKQVELDHKIQEMTKNQLDIEQVSSLFGVDLTVLFSYRIAKKTDDFVWLRKDIKNGDLNLLIYQLPFGTIKKDSTTIKNIVKLRDSIGKTHIPGPVKNSYMITENSFSPFLGTTSINGNTAFESRGVWDVKNDFMAGPFINYIINDKKNNRQLVLEGFTYAPQIAKRDYMFELEAMIKSIKIK
jgi:hypothetical protein